MKKALVITFSKIQHDARVKRQISFLENDFEVHLACFDSYKDFRSVKISPPRLSLMNKLVSGAFLILRLYDKAYDKLYGQNLNLAKDFDLVIANDIEALPLAFQLKGKAKILFDAHEYAPRHFENKLSWRIFFQGFNKFLCKKYIPKVDAMITVGEVIAQEYEKQYGVKPTVITNAPPYSDIAPKTVAPDKIRMVHQGIANPSRKLELMFEMMNHLDERFELDLMLINPMHKSHIAYLEKLKKMAAENGRIHFIPAVPTDQVITTINQYDLGIILIPPINFNYRNTLPNKFFECIQARTAVAIGPIPEIKKITEHYNIGIVSEDFSAKSLANKIQSLSAEQINTFKFNTNKAAEDMNAGKNKLVFREIIQWLFNHN
jgi:hypothetical protein